MTKESVRAGVSRIDITPKRLPAVVNGDFFERRVSLVEDPLSVRTLVLERGETVIVLSVVDSCLLPEQLLDTAKETVWNRTGIPTDRILISATHCHSAPSVLAILGSGIDTEYAARLPDRIAEGIVRAHENLEEVRLGHAADADPDNVFCRRFIMKPGTAWTENADFTGSPGDLAQMNPEGKRADIVCPTGRPDPTVGVLACRRPDGRPLCLLGNYSTHYAGAEGISADYFAVFADRVATLLGAGDDFLGILSNGTSGDANCIDFRNETRTFDRFTVGRSVAQAAGRAWRKIDFREDARLDMLERRLELSIRKPTARQVELARNRFGGAEIPEPNALKSREDVYARETILLDAMPERVSLKLQALRIGTLGIVAVPCEVYTATGREIRAASPFAQTFVISNANGAFGYIPTEDSFMYGGYTTWRARSSMLEEGAERKIRLAALGMLAELSAADTSTIERRA